MDVRAVYLKLWKFEPPAACVEMHAAGLFQAKSAKALSLAVFEFHDAETLAEGDVFVAESLIPGFAPIGGDSSGDRWCFDARAKSKTPGAVIHCPHDMEGAVYVAPDFAAFVYRLLVEELSLLHLYEGWKKSRDEVAVIARANLAAVRPWLGERAKNVEKLIEGARWPAEGSIDVLMRRERDFAAMPKKAFPQFA